MNGMHVTQYILYSVMICHINFRVLKVCNIFPMKSENLNFRGYRIFAFKAKENL